MTKALSVIERNIVILSVTFTASVLALLFVFPLQAHAATLSGQLDMGQRSADVTSLQTFLAGDASIYPEGLVTGYFGQLTFAAVSRFQTAHGLPSVGRVGPLTLALINSQMGIGGGVPENANTTGDISAPLMYPEAVSATSNSVTISWTTSEPAKSRVLYGTTWPFLYSTAPSVRNSTIGLSPNITITGLQSHTTYYYTLESIDVAGNVMVTVGKPVMTK